MPVYVENYVLAHKSLPSPLDRGLRWMSRRGFHRFVLMPPRDMKSTTRVLKNHIESLGYRVCVACDDPVWICSAKNDEAGQFFVAKSDTEDRAIAELCELIGIDLEDG